MRLRALTVALSMAFQSTHAVATTVDDVRSLLLEGNVKTLENAISELASATDQESIALYRDISDRLFRSSHPVYLATLADWLEQEPRSGAALAANAWAALNDLELKSSPYGGPGFAMPKIYEFQQRWVISKGRVLDLTTRALRTDRRNVSAMDAWLFTQRLKPADSDTARVADKLIDLAPDRQSVRNIVAANVEFAQSRSRAAVKTCHRYAERANDYDRNLCMIEAAFEFFLERDFIDEARKQLAKTDDPRLDPLRMMAAIYFQDGVEDGPALASYLRATLMPRVWTNQYLHAANMVASVNGGSDFFEEAQSELAERIDEWLKDDSLNPSYLKHQAVFQRKQGNFATSQELWNSGLVHGWPDLYYWLEGVITAASEDDLASAAAYAEGAAAAAGGKIELLEVHQIFSDAVEQSSDIPSDELLCLRLRLARLSRGLCEVYGQQAGSKCKQGHPLFESVTATLSKTSQTCPAISAAPISALQFSPLLAEETAAALADR